MAGRSRQICEFKASLVYKESSRKPCLEKPKALFRCWWDCKLVQLLWKSVWRFLRKLDPAIPLQGLLKAILSCFLSVLRRFPPGWNVSIYRKLLQNTLHFPLGITFFPCPLPKLSVNIGKGDYRCSPISKN